MSGSLGIYFGAKLISIVETKGRKVVNGITIRRSIVSGDELGEKVPEEVKMVALFSDELRKNKIGSKEATISLSGRDLIVRTFDLPLMPQAELASAVNFEARKYIPFKIEDMVSDFQIEADKANKKNLVLFVGIKQETLDKHLSILSQLNIKANYIEYCAFSLLRFLRIAGLRDKGIAAVIGADLQEEKEASFTVLENGFPVFSRDIALTSGPEELAPAEEPAGGMSLEKLKTEVRISLDYYNRKYPMKKIGKVFFVCDKNYASDLEFFIKDLGLAAQFIDTSRQLEMRQGFTLSFINGYGASLYKVIRTNLKVNLLAPKVKIKAPVAKKIAPEVEAAPLFAGVKIRPRTIIAGLSVCALAFGLGFYQTLPIRRELNSIVALRPKVPNVSPSARYEELKGIDSDYKNKINTLDALVRKQLYLTEPMNIIPQAIPEDMWLTDFTLEKQQDSRSELTLKGFAYQGDSEKELRSVDVFISELKESPEFTKYFKEIKIASVEQQKQVGKMKVTSFTIFCRSAK